MSLQANQEEALENYFDGLLFTDGNAALKEEPSVVRPTPPSPALRAPKTKTVFRAIDPSSVAKEKKEEVKEAVEPVKEAINEGKSAIEKSMTEDQFLFVRPLSVVGLSLALPMERITEVIAYNEAKVNLLNRDGTILGSMTYGEREIIVLDTASIIVPQNHARRTAMLERKNYQHILVLDKGSLAIAVDTLDEEVYLPTDNIRWNAATSQHTWLAGTMVDYGYALVNADRLTSYLG